MSNADVDFSQVIGPSFQNTGTKNKGRVNCSHICFTKGMFNILSNKR